RWHEADRQQAPPWRALQRDDFRAYLRYLGRHQLSRAAIRLRFSALRTFYKFLARAGEVEHSPIKNLSLPKPEKRLPRFLTRQQIQDLLAAPFKERGPASSQEPAPRRAGRPVDATVPERDVAILETFYSCGLRVGELCGLRGEDINWSEQLVR